MPRRLLVGLLAVAVLAGGALAVRSLSDGGFGLRSLVRSPPNILLITVETLRRDHCSLYGYERDTTPFLDELAAESIVFDNAWSHSSWTYPSMACVLSGRMPEETGVWHAASPVEDDALSWLAGIEQGGYNVACFSTNHFVDRLLARAPKGTESAAYSRAPLWVLHQATRKWFDRDVEQPWCLTWHAFDPHDSYDAPHRHRDAFSGDYGGPLRDSGILSAKLSDISLSAEDRRYVVARYDAEILYLDHVLRRFVEDLRERRQWDNTCLILTADHGERFGDEGWGHGGKPTDAVTAVPFLIRLPGGKLGGTRTGALVGGIDVLPTLLTQAGVPVPEDLPGVNAVSLLNDPRPDRVLEQHVVGIDWQDEEQTTYKLRSRHRGRLCGTTHSIEEVPVTPADAAPQAGDESVLADLRDLGYL